MNQSPFTFFINTEEDNLFQNGGNRTHALKYLGYDCLTIYRRTADRFI